ncbi:MAG TPA: hypothetical protein QF509_00820 [Rhodospirillales bacterium]|nr:hypothetical protein [Rhodospirillales bacterium]
METETWTTHDPKVDTVIIDAPPPPGLPSTTTMTPVAVGPSRRHPLYRITGWFPATRKARVKHIAVYRGTGR